MSRKKSIEVDFIIESVKLNVHNTQRDCHQNSRIIHQKMKDLGHDVELKKGVYVNPPKRITHSWLESEHSIFETDCRQLIAGPQDIMPDEVSAILPKDDFKHRYIAKSNTIETENI